MKECIICYCGGYEFEIPHDIGEKYCKKIDLLINKKEFHAVVALWVKKGGGENFFIASRINFLIVFNVLIKAGVPYDRLVKPPPLQKKIDIVGRDYLMREEFLTVPSKPIDLVVSKENLFLFYSVIKESKLKFFLIYGTLLGAVREADFIEHDSDTDLGMYFSDRDKFLPFIFKLKEEGFDLVRYDSHLLSLMRLGEYIDVYFFEKKIIPSIGWYSGSLFIPSKFLNKLGVYLFHQKEFLVPDQYEKFFVFCYGENWRVPLKNKHAKKLFSMSSFFLRMLPFSLKMFLKRVFN